MALIKRKGVWYVRKTINGKEYRISTKVKDRKVAERRETDIVRRLWSSEFAWKARTAPTFREWAERYQRAYTVRKRAPWRDRQNLGSRPTGLGPDSGSPNTRKLAKMCGFPRRNRILDFPVDTHESPGFPG
jgi:hypothetical protein